MSIGLKIILYHYSVFEIGISKETCNMCKNAVQSDEFYFINCYDNHSSCLLCYKQRLQNQVHLPIDDDPSTFIE